MVIGHALERRPARKLAPAARRARSQHLADRLDNSEGAGNAPKVLSQFLASGSRLRIQMVLRVLLFLILGPALTTEAGADQPIRVQTSARLVVQDGERIRLMTTTNVSMPAAYRDAKRLRSGRQSDPAYEAARARVLAGYGLFGQRQFNLPSALDSPPQMVPRVAGGRATVSIVANSEEGTCCPSVGPWMVWRHRGDLRLSIAAQRVPADVRWTADVDIDGSRLDRLAPMPARTAGADRATWTPRTSSRSTELVARVALTDIERRTIAAAETPALYATPGLWGLSDAAVFLLLLLVIGRVRSGGELEIKRRRALALTSTWICLAITIVWWLWLLRSEAVLEDAWPDEAFVELCALALETYLPLLSCGAGVLVIAGVNGDRGNTLKRVSIVGLLVGLPAAIAVAARSAGPPFGLSRFNAWEFPYGTPSWIDTAAAALLAGLTSLFALLFVMLGAQFAWSGGRRAVVTRWMAATCAAVSVGGVGQWYWWLTHLVDARDAQYTAGFAVDDRLPLEDTLLVEAVEQPHEIVLSLSYVFFIAGVGIAAFWLHQRAKSEPATPILTSRRALVLLTGVLALSLGGPFDRVLGYPLPLTILAFASTFTLVLVASAGRANDLRARASRLDEAARVRLLLSTGPVQRFRRARHAMYLEHAEGTIDSTEYAVRHERWVRGARLLQPSPLRKPRWISWLESALPAQQPPEGSQNAVVRQGALPDSIALGLGPAADWWENAVIAVRIGAVLGLAPTAVAVASAQLRTGWSDFSSSSPNGALWALSMALDQYSTWLVGAFVFGCLFARLPGRNGAVKGVVIGVVAATAFGATLVLPAVPWDQSVGLFIGAVLLFFVVLGMTIDWWTLRARHVYWRHLLDHYAASRAQFVLGYAVPILIATGFIVQQIIAGQVADALTGDQQARLTELIRSMPIEPAAGGRVP